MKELMNCNSMKIFIKYQKFIKITLLREEERLKKNQTINIRLGFKQYKRSSCWTPLSIFSFKIN